MTEPSPKDPPAEAPPPESEGEPTASAIAEQKKPAPARPKPKRPSAAPGKGKKLATPAVSRERLRRRKFVWWNVFGVIGVSVLASIRFFFPRALFEPATRFKIGYPSEYGFGVDTKWQGLHRIWVVRDPTSLYVIFARCTHLGCTPDWKPSESKFKCPCHGSGFTMEGVNFEGPAPYPLYRVAVSLDTQGEIVVDKGRFFPVDHWKDAEAFIAV